MTKPVMFFKLQKVDIEKRLVYGIATAEVVDKAGEICDYASTVPHYKAWSEEFAKATDGLSVGNLRVMHSTKVAGPIKSIDFDDENKCISICGKVVDDGEWKMVLEGGYTGFSQGGSYIKTWADPDQPGVRRYTAAPAEVSLVDNPCVGIAHFEVIKANGEIELRKFHTVAKDENMTTNIEQLFKAKNGKTFKTSDEAYAENVQFDAQEAAKNAIAPMQKILDELNAKLDGGEYWDSEAYLNKAIPTAELEKLKGVDAGTASIAKKKFSAEKRKQLAAEGKALPDGSFPIEDKEDLHNAIQAHGRASDPEKAKAHIIARAKALGAESELPDDWKEGDGKKSLTPAMIKTLLAAVRKRGQMNKSLHDVARVACLMSELDWVHEGLEMEAAIEGDNSPAPAHLMEILRELTDFLKNLLEEETSEMLGGEEEDYAAILEMAAKLPEDQAARMAKSIASHKSEGVEQPKLLALIDALTKAGARHSKGDMEHITTMHGHLKKMDKCMGGMHECMKGLGMDENGKMGPEAETEKAALAENLAKTTALAERTTAERDAMVKSVETMTNSLTEMSKRLANLESQPADDKNRPKTFSLDKQHGVKPSDKTTDGGERQAIPSRVTPSEFR